MSKNCRFRGPLDKQHGKRSQGLLKSASQHLYHIQWSLPSKLSSKKSLILAWKISGLLVNTLAANEKYPFVNRDKLTIPIQMQWSQKQKTFSHFSLHFWNIAQNLDILMKKTTLIDFVFSKLRTPKT